MVRAYVRMDEEQLDDLEYCIAGLLEEPWDKGEERPARTDLLCCWLHEPSLVHSPQSQRLEGLVIELAAVVITPGHPLRPPNQSRLTYELLSNKTFGQCPMPPAAAAERAELMAQGNIYYDSPSARHNSDKQAAEPPPEQGILLFYYVRQQERLIH